ncbi:MAG TPA: S46 family peptidase, partial [Bacteroidia bacterium]|nr:S46 family peptidase [Bacteroidia bacterium]
FIGQTEQIKRLKVVDYKKAEETRFKAWAADKAEYKDIFPTLEKAYQDYLPVSTLRTYMDQGISGALVFGMAANFIFLEKAMGADGNAEAKQKTIDGLKKRSEAYMKLYNAPAERNITAAMLTMFYIEVPKDQHPAIFGEILAKYPGTTPEEAFAKYTDEMMASTMMNSQEKMNAFFANPSLEQLQADPAYKVVKSVVDNYQANYEARVNAFNKTVEEQGSLYIKGLMEMDKTRTFYPDANSTMRLTYGSVRSYKPKDGVSYSYVTTLDGVEEKFVPGDDEFDAPARLMELNKNNDFGIYGDKKTGELVTCFITDNDITGGNSGSPVVNGKGELIGLAFDGNWEAMSGDIVYDDRYKRTINVDVRYVLFLIDKLAGATHIVKEMNLVQNGKKVTLK